MSSQTFACLAARFPDPNSAQPDGLLAFGGNLNPQTLLAAYSRGIFPWFSQGDPILWWSPDPRCVMPLADFHLPSRTIRKLRRTPFTLTLNRAFSRVIAACAGPRQGQEGTWITPEMLKAYEQLHALGYAISVEAWQDGELAGGLYGVVLGRAFSGESMFHVKAEASRAALNGLVILLRQLRFIVLDCQQATPHMLAMGAKSIARKDYCLLLASALKQGSGDSQGGICPWPAWQHSFRFEPESQTWLQAVS